VVVGQAVGSREGFLVLATIGLNVGEIVGITVGSSELGSSVGSIEGFNVGRPVGLTIRVG